MNKKNIVIVGGGTAGWLAALFAKKRFPDENIMLIESLDIGILGAGEGTVPALLKSFDYLDISLKDLISNTKSTIKNGIKFTNWSEDGGSYMHGFTFEQNISPFIESIEFKDKHFLNSRIFGYAHKMKDEDHCYYTMISDQNRVPYGNVDVDYEYYSQHAIHFDARVMAKFLKEKSLERGVIYIENEVVDCQIDGEDIKSITLKDNTILETDFLIDCTGFARYFLGGKLGGEWISYSDSLPANSAQAFFMEMNNPEEIEPYTESTAMDFGWVWKIPLQHRYGCGYVYDSRLISNEDVRKEIVEKYGEVQFVKHFVFDPGTFKNIWIGNCMAVGLAANFVEPLEATSLQMTAAALNRAFHPEVDIFNPFSMKDRINSRSYTDSEIVKDFIYLHYMTNKTNNSFWKDFTIKNKMPDSLKPVYDNIVNVELIHEYDLMWPEYSFYIVAYGNGIMDQSKLIDFADKNLNIFSKQIHSNFDIKKKLSKKSCKHYEFLKINGGFNE
jgi:tryptophan halogenase